MSTINPVSNFPPVSVEGFQRPPPLRTPSGGPGGAQSVEPSDFGDLLGKVVDTVQAQHAEAQASARAVLAGESDQVHQTMIAMQESSVAFTLMVEVRNRLVESYQELMRMPV